MKQIDVYFFLCVLYEITIRIILSRSCHAIRNEFVANELRHNITILEYAKHINMYLFKGGKNARGPVIYVHNILN